MTVIRDVKYAGHLQVTVEADDQTTTLESDGSPAALLVLLAHLYHPPVLDHLSPNLLVVDEKIGCPHDRMARQGHE